ncbi:GNAT family N-acetyltransferase [Paenibacillus turpanensis]|uniref:GNAT family N-acetyltransferase n=1 Tax=Paenibacillus turpanensis TaxID=2689078 RepID=UPI00140DC181|nr:GNAT family N-acetyltransferase [Paenibacillus turpanensis]
MYIRSFQLSDSAPVTELLREVLTEECCQETMAALTRQLSWDSELVVVAVEDELPVGIIIGTIEEGDGYFYRIAVHTDYQRRGIGRSLAKALQARFEQRKVKSVKVTADEHNEPILPLYAAVGVAVG